MCLTGRAQAVFHRLPDGDKNSFDAAVKALEAHFEPKGKRELYLAEFTTRTKKLSESWMTYGEELRWLAAKAYPDLTVGAHEQLALTHFLHSITDPQLVLAVKQKNPETVVDAVTATMQTECILASARIAAASHHKDETVSAVSRDDKLLDLITKLSDKIDNISIQPRYSSRPRPMQQFRPPRQSDISSSQSSRRPVVCHRCHQEGHFARGCAAPRQTLRQGNEQPPAP